MRRLVSGFLISLSLALSAPVRASGETPAVCDTPPEFVTTDASLAKVGTAIAAGGPVDILAVGSATTVGAVSTSDQKTTATDGSTFPEQMVRALNTELPKVRFNLTVRGGRGLAAEAMLKLIEEALKQQRYQLVMWQTGTVEAVRGLRPDGLLDVLHQGLDDIRDAGGDVVLVNPQFSRFLRANTDIDAYEEVMRQAAGTTSGVALFHRFELMRTWADDGVIDLERTAKVDRDKTLDRLNFCLGQALAKLVLNGAAVSRK
jgi:acyl-CoA thioesterase-1